MFFTPNLPPLQFACQCHPLTLSYAASNASYTNIIIDTANNFRDPAGIFANVQYVDPATPQLLIDYDLYKQLCIELTISRVPQSALSAQPHLVSAINQSNGISETGWKNLNWQILSVRAIANGTTETVTFTMPLQNILNPHFFDPITRKMGISIALQYSRNGPNAGNFAILPTFCINTPAQYGAWVDA